MVLRSSAEAVLYANTEMMLDLNLAPPFSILKEKHEEDLSRRMWRRAVLYGVDSLGPWCVAFAECYFSK